MAQFFKIKKLSSLSNQYITLQQISVKKKGFALSTTSIEILSSGNYCLAFKQPEPDD